MKIKFDKNGNIAKQKVNYIIKHNDYTKAMIQEAKSDNIQAINKYYCSK